MTKIIDLVNAPQGKRILIEMFENGNKCAEVDLSGMKTKDIKDIIRLQELQGRTWEYKTINLK